METDLTGHEDVDSVRIRQKTSVDFTVTTSLWKRLWEGLLLWSLSGLIESRVTLCKRNDWDGK